MRAARPAASRAEASAAWRRPGVPPPRSERGRSPRRRHPERRGIVCDPACVRQALARGRRAQDACGDCPWRASLRERTGRVNGGFGTRCRRAGCRAQGGVSSVAPAMRAPTAFVTDSSLALVARRLRFLGYDVATHPGARLEELFAAAREQGRTVLTLS